MATVYEINKGIGGSVEFKGIKAQYIIYLAIGMVVLLLLFAILYKLGISIYICLGIVLVGGGGFVAFIQRMSSLYGEHGLKKKMAIKYLPKAIISRSRNTFVNLKKQSGEKK